MNKNQTIVYVIDGRNLETSQDRWGNRWLV